MHVIKITFQTSTFALISVKTYKKVYYEFLIKTDEQALNLTMRKVLFNYAFS